MLFDWTSDSQLMSSNSSNSHRTPYELSSSYLYALFKVPSRSLRVVFERSSIFKPHQGTSNTKMIILPRIDNTWIVCQQKWIIYVRKIMPQSSFNWSTSRFDVLWSLFWSSFGSLTLLECMKCNVWPHLIHIFNVHRRQFVNSSSISIESQSIRILITSSGLSIFLCPLI